jgi:hypothetical protein
MPIAFGYGTQNNEKNVEDVPQSASKLEYGDTSGNSANRRYAAIKNDRIFYISLVYYLKYRLHTALLR